MRLPDGYAFEGHIPVADVVKFLKERPAGAIALVVPGMPMELPGMETGGSRQSLLDVLLVSANAAPSRLRPPLNLGSATSSPVRRAGTPAG